MTPELNHEITKNLAAGTAAGIAKFIKINNINIKPGTKSDKPAVEFVKDFMSDGVEGGTYPFNESFVDRVKDEANGLFQVADDMMASGEEQTLMAWARVVGLGECLKFLDERRIEAVGLINAKRGDDL